MRGGDGFPRQIAVVREDRRDAGTRRPLPPTVAPSPLMMVVCPTRTPATSVIAFIGPGGRSPKRMPSSRARARRLDARICATVESWAAVSDAADTFTFDGKNRLRSPEENAAESDLPHGPLPCRKSQTAARYQDTRFETASPPDDPERCRLVGLVLADEQHRAAAEGREQAAAPRPRLVASSSSSPRRFLIGA